MRWVLSFLATLLCACQSPRHAPLSTVARVDLQRFMGAWYVIASIPTFIENGAHNAIESYRLDSDGSIDTTFTFRAGSFDGPVKRYNPRGFIRDTDSHAVWGMRFIWPFRADYRIIYLTDDYQQTVIGRQQRDYVWIMSRTPTLPAADYQRIVQQLATQGYDVTRIKPVPQRWGSAP